MDSDGWDKLSECFSEYILSYHKQEIVDILCSEILEKHYSVIVNFVSLFDAAPLIGGKLLMEPLETLPVCNDGLKRAQLILLESRDGASFKPNVHTRFTAVAVQAKDSSLPCNEDIGRFVSVCGTVVRRSAPSLLEYCTEYICGKCKYSFIANAEYEIHYVLQPVKECQNPEGCKSKSIHAVTNNNFKDYQEIKIQEQVGKLGFGSMPRSLLVTLEDDLVDICKPGDDVTVCGIVRRRWKVPFTVDCRPAIDLSLDANWVNVRSPHSSEVAITVDTRTYFDAFWEEHSKRPLVGRDIIISSMCPQVYGLYIVKLGLALCLVGGVGLSHGPEAASVRGEPHMLLVGSPGSAKSQMVKFAAVASARSVLTTGIGSTSAGLTVAAVMNHGEWQLEAGALVLADGGVCCIDEFNSIRESDKASIHEAMEQQTISVAKAGIVCRLHTRCSVIAATNPKGSYDPSNPVSVNCGIASPLLSRFDLVFILLDSRNPSWDRMISSFILSGKCPSESSTLWTVERLQAYLMLVKGINPVLTDDAIEVLRTYYQTRRAAHCPNAARTTVRLLESLIRLAESHARLMMRERVEVIDCIVVVTLMEASLTSMGLFGNQLDPLLSTFPRDPYADYLHQAEVILSKLNLECILEKEKKAYSSLCNSENINEQS